MNKWKYLILYLKKVLYIFYILIELYKETTISISTNLALYHIILMFLFILNV